MRFDGVTTVTGPRDAVWSALHDPAVLRELVTGCDSMTPVREQTYAARMVARVGPMSDTYRGTFTITDHETERHLGVAVRARGRCGRLDLDLRVQLFDADSPGSTRLAYLADATVGGLVSRLSGPALRVAGAHFTGCFFRSLDHHLDLRLRDRVLLST